MNTVEESVLRKIKKCLDLAQDGRGDPATAAIALKQAQALMEKHGVTMSSVHESQVVEAAAQTGAWNKIAPWESQLGFLLSKAFGCQFTVVAWPTYLRKLAEFRFLGMPGHVETCAYAFTVIRREIAKARSVYVATLSEWASRGEKIAEGDAFVDGYMLNLEKQISELVLTPEQLQAITDRKLKVLGDNKDKVHKGRGDKSDEGSSSAYFAGKAAGEKLSVHRATELEERLRLEGGSGAQ